MKRTKSSETHSAGVGGKGDRRGLRLRKAAEDGDPIAQHELGLLFENGEGTATNFSEAFNWYLRAAESGLSLAIWTVGRMYAQGRGVARNGTKALSWFLRLADPRTTEDSVYMGWAQWSIGQMYMEGIAVPQDKMEALKWLHLAAASGDKRAADLVTQLTATMSAAELRETEARLLKMLPPQGGPKYSDN